MIRVLLVEDEAFVRMAMRKLIDWDGSPFRLAAEATNGREALSILERQAIEVVVTDIRMPVMDGLELIREMRARGYRQEIIVLSAFDEFEFARAALQHGACDYIHKPTMEPDDLFRALGKARERLTGSERETPPPEPTAQRQAREGEDGRRLHRAVSAAREFVARHYHEELSLERAAEQVRVHPSYLSRLFRRETSETFVDFLTRTRLQRAKELLCSTDLYVYQVGERVGYPNSKYFCQLFKSVCGLTPQAFREGHRAPAGTAPEGAGQDSGVE